MGRVNSRARPYTMERCQEPTVITSQCSVIGRSRVRGQRELCATSRSGQFSTSAGSRHDGDFARWSYSPCSGQRPRPPLFPTPVSVVSCDARTPSHAARIEL